MIFVQLNFKRSHVFGKIMEFHVFRSYFSYALFYFIIKHFLFLLFGSPKIILSILFDLSYELLTESEVVGWCNGAG